MITTVVADGKNEYEFIDLLKKRAQNSDKNVVPIVSEIIENVAENGDKAVKEYTVKFDGKAPEKVEITSDEIDSLIEKCDKDYLETIKKAAANIADFHKRQVQQSWLTTKNNGVMMGQRIRGLKRVGIYVPGGTAAYPSSVLMNAVPAKIAGVEEIIMCTPPQKDGTPNPNIIAAAKVAGVDRIFLMGGAQAVAALAYGTESVPKVDKIVGPGNAFVAMAKRLVFGTVGIDMIAGPSEVCCVADGSANPKWIAADLLSQAEHDPRAAVFLITPDKDFGLAVQKEMEKQMKELSRYEIMKSSVDQYAKAFLCKDAEQCFDIVNKIAPEHLEVELPDPKKYLPLIYNAGAIFLGKYTSEPIGDYMAGPNHTLPTSGTAAFSSPLGVYDFVKHSSVECYSEEAFRKISKKVQLFAKAEGLTAHAHAMEVRDED